MEQTDPITTLNIPGLVKTKQDFFGNVNASPKLQYHFPPEGVHRIYVECSQLYHSTEGRVEVKCKAAMLQFNNQREAICRMLGINQHDWLLLLKFLRREIHHLIAIHCDNLDTQTDFRDRCDCLNLLCNDNGIYLVRNPTIRSGNGSVEERDRSNDTLLLHQEMFPRIFQFHVQKLAEDTLNYKMLVETNGLSLRQLTHGSEGLLPKIRQSMTANSQIYIDNPTIYFMIDTEAPFKKPPSSQQPSSQQLVARPPRMPAVVAEDAVDEEITVANHSNTNFLSNGGNQLAAPAKATFDPTSLVSAVAASTGSININFFSGDKASVYASTTDSNNGDAPATKTDMSNLEKSIASRMDQQDSNANQRFDQQETITKNLETMMTPFTNRTRNAAGTPRTPQDEAKKFCAERSIGLCHGIKKGPGDCQNKPMHGKRVCYIHREQEGKV